MTIFEADASDAVSATDKVVGTFRMSLSYVHLTGAALFSRNTGSIEMQHTGQPCGDFWEELQAQATACIMLSVAALEAFANELFVDREKYFPGISKPALDKLWELYEKKDVIEKYKLALVLHETPPMDMGSAVGQNLLALIKLRNALVHYKPEWVDEQVAHRIVSEALNNRAGRCPFLPEWEPLFPRAWVSHRSTRWAVTSVVRFLTDFEERLSVPSRLQPLLSRLAAL